MEEYKALISILNYNGSEDTLNCIKSFYHYEEVKNYSIVIWDNHSEIKEQEQLKKGLLELKYRIKICSNLEYETLNIQNFDIVLVLSSENLGFAKGNNHVIRKQINNFDYIILLNNDTIFELDTTKRIINYLHKHNSVGIATSSIYYYHHPESIWNAGGKMFFGTRKYYTEKYVNEKLKNGITDQYVDYITGCFMVVKSAIFQQFGLLTEKYFFGEEDYEFCKRMKRNKVKLIVLFNEKLYHKVGASISRNNLSSIYTIRKSFIHHLNRFIDMKYYYPALFWECWRLSSSIYIFLLMFMKSKGNLKLIMKYILLLNYYAKRKNGVGKKFFLAVLNGKII